ncbi:MAG TPA: YraN family protein [Puia sp.]|nr:YraN family protein [Puia sp.]
MAKHNDLGKEGEELAVAWFKDKDYQILHCNWRHSHYEVDIIANRNNILHFIEVKARRSKTFGYPEESVGKKKIKNLMNAAEEFLIQFPEWKRIQFNVLSILLKKDNKHEYFLIEDISL